MRFLTFCIYVQIGQRLQGGSVSQFVSSAAQTCLENLFAAVNANGRATRILLKREGHEQKT